MTRLSSMPPPTNGSILHKRVFLGQIQTMDIFGARQVRALEGFSLMKYLKALVKSVLWERN